MVAAALSLIFPACAHDTDAREPGRIGMNHPVSLSRYAGTWHELARTPNRYQDNTPRRNGRSYSPCTKTTATYRIENDTSLRLKNTCIRSAEDGTTYEDVAQGVARVVPDSDNRQLQVAFGPAIARFFQRLFALGRSNYWIIDVGDTQGRSPYPWAVVSGPGLDFLYLLTRTPNPSPQIREEMLASARKAGLPVHRLKFTR